MTSTAGPTDLKKQLPSYTARRGRFDVLTVPPLTYLMIDGHGDPNTAPAYADALATLYPVAYTLKLLSRDELARDHVVMPLEALWWSDDMASFTSARDKSTWSWTAMILTPEWITGGHVATAVAAVRQKRGDDGAPALDRLRHETLDEGLVVQTLHVGPDDDEGPVLAEMHGEVIPARSLEMTRADHDGDRGGAHVAIRPGRRPHLPRAGARAHRRARAAARPAVGPAAPTGRRAIDRPRPVRRPPATRRRRRGLHRLDPATAG